MRYNLQGSLPSRGKRQALVKSGTARVARGQRGDHHRILNGAADPACSVDYVFVDPPFGENIPYSDLALLVEQWHGVTTATAEEATEDKFKGRGLMSMRT